MAVKKVRKLKFVGKLVIVIFIAILCLGILCLSSFFFCDKEVKKEKIKKVVEKEKYPKESSFKLFMVGDALIHSAIYEDAELDDGSYDFKPMLELIKPISLSYDLAYYNQETILGGSDLGFSNYPMFNSPDEVGDAFIDAGFNLVSLATNHTMDKGEEVLFIQLTIGLIKKMWFGMDNVLPGRKEIKLAFTSVMVLSMLSFHTQLGQMVWKHLVVKNI